MRKISYSTFTHGKKWDGFRAEPVFSRFRPDDLVLEDGFHPHFELEPADHPLSQEYHHRIALERVKEIMMGRLGRL